MVDYITESVTDFIAYYTVDYNKTPQQLLDKYYKRLADKIIKRCKKEANKGNNSYKYRLNDNDNSKDINILTDLINKEIIGADVYKIKTTEKYINYNVISDIYY